MLYRLIISSFFALVSLHAISQNEADIKKGDVCMDKAEYAKAAIYYRKAAESSPKSVYLYRKLAKALLAVSDYQSAEPVYGLICSSVPDSSIDHFYYAQILRRNGKYSESDKAYQAYFREHPDDQLAGEFLYFGDNARHIAADTPRYKLVNIDENTAGSEVGPTFCLYDLCFSSNKHADEENFDLYLRQAGNPANPAAPEKLKGDINGKLIEGPATFSHDGKEIIFTRSNYDHKSEEGQNKLGLYHADYDAGKKKWVNIKPLDFIDYNYNFEQPSLSKDDTTLYFVSDIRGGFGGSDIYVSHKRDNKWSSPVNLGKRINTKGKEQTPFIANDSTLYFASDSRLGLGGLDIYSVKFSDDAWGFPVNLGVPLNSAYDDFGYISDATGQSGYIVSNRPGGKGGNDIYQFTAIKKK